MQEIMMTQQELMYQFQVMLERNLLPTLSNPPYIQINHELELEMRRQIKKTNAIIDTNIIIRRPQTM